MVFIETSVFTRGVADLLSDGEYSALQRHLVAHPEEGDVIQQTGGLRKIRWSADGKGKRGGVRIIYYYVMSQSQIRMLLIYRKGRVDTLTASQKFVLRQINERWL